MSWHAWSIGSVMALIGTTHQEPAQDRHVYKFYFPDGHPEELAVNAIAEVFIPSVMRIATSISCWTP